MFGKSKAKTTSLEGHIPTPIFTQYMQKKKKKSLQHGSQPVAQCFTAAVCLKLKKFKVLTLIFSFTPKT